MLRSDTMSSPSIFLKQQIEAHPAFYEEAHELWDQSLERKRFENGSYFIRPATESAYCIVVKTQKAVDEFFLEVKENQITVNGERSYQNLTELFDHYEEVLKKPI